MIGFVGLVIPHATRMVFGQTHRTLLPVAFCLGGTLLVSADVVARMAFAPASLPVGVVTATGRWFPSSPLLLRKWTS